MLTGRLQPKAHAHAHAFAYNLIFERLRLGGQDHRLNPFQEETLTMERFLLGVGIHLVTDQADEWRLGSLLLSAFPRLTERP